MYFNDTLGHVLLQIFPNQATSSKSYALRFLNDRREYSWFTTTWQGGNIGRRNNRIFSQRIYIKIEFSSQRREKLLFLTINMAAVTSRTGCLAVLFWSGRVRLSGGPPPPPPLSEETPNPNPTDIQWLNFAFDLGIQIVKRISPTTTPLRTDLTFSSFSMYNREERSLRHVAMVAKFLDDNKPKIHFALFKTSLILFNLIQFVKCSRNFWVKSQRTVSKFTKKGRKFFVLCSPTP